VSDSPNRTREIQVLEQEAEALVAHQLDLLAQLERQLRAVHRTMRDIEKLRSARHRVGPQLTNVAREETLAHLATTIADVDSNITIEHECCGEMLVTVTAMRERIARLQGRVASGSIPDDSDPPSHGSGAA
jgi:hypothetical protein